jgi:hypothetical protein
MIIKEKERPLFQGTELDKRKRVIIFLLKIKSYVKGVIDYDMGTYKMGAF